jgi:hypothetical protein
MTNPAKARGDRAELEAAAMLTQLLGVTVRRKLGAGRRDDQGDLDGVPASVMQVAYRPSDTLRAVREKPLAAEAQRLRAQAPFAASMIRFRGGEWRVVMTPAQYADLLRAALGK